MRVIAAAKEGKGRVREHRQRGAEEGARCLPPTRRSLFIGVGWAGAERQDKEHPSMFI